MTSAFDWLGVVFRSDVDWVIQDCIEDAYVFARSRDIKPCFFITHDSSVMNALAVEVGLHPNFLPGSTHGDDQDYVIECGNGSTLLSLSKTIDEVKSLGIHVLWALQKLLDPIDR